MVTAIAIPQEQKNVLKFQQAAQQFQTELMQRHPRIGELQSWDAILQAIIKSYVDLQMPATSLSNSKSFWAAFHGCVQDRTIFVPAAEPVITQETINRIREKYPVVITKDRELTQRERSALAGVSQVSNNHAADVRETNRKIDDTYASERAARNTTRLRNEYRELRAKAETAMSDNPRSHGQNQAERKRLLAELNSNPKFAAVRD
jgi:hypothetical protein